MQSTANPHILQSQIHSLSLELIIALWKRTGISIVKPAFNFLHLNHANRWVASMRLGDRFENGHEVEAGLPPLDDLWNQPDTEPHCSDAPNQITDWIDWNRLKFQ